MFQVILDRYDGDDFQNDTTCNVCEKKGTVAVIFGKKICGVCLDIAHTDIHRAILPDAGRVPEELK